MAALITDAHRIRAIQAQIADSALVDLRTLMSHVATISPEKGRDLLLETLPHVAQTYGEFSAVGAGEWYEELRVREVGSGRSSVLSPTATTAEIEGSVRFAVAHLFDEQPELTEAYLARQMRKWVNQPARGTLIRSVDSDPVGYGWQRVTRAGACDFCKMLADRGGVYTRKSVYFASHGSCNCGVVPSWDHSLPEVDVKCYEESARMAALRRRAANGATDDDIRNARRVAGRAWSGPVTDADRRKYSDNAREIISDHNARAREWMDTPDPAAGGSGGKKPPSPRRIEDWGFDPYKATGADMHHVIQGEARGFEWKGGHRSGQGIGTKTEFPASWDAKDIRRAVQLTFDEPQYASISGDRFVFRREVDGVIVEASYFKQGDRVTFRNAYPKSGHGVIENAAHGAVNKPLDLSQLLP